MHICVKEEFGEWNAYVIVLVVVHGDWVVPVVNICIRGIFPIAFGCQSISLVVRGTKLALLLVRVVDARTTFTVDCVVLSGISSYSNMIGLGNLPCVNIYFGNLQ
jgi:hypothetical protein